MNKKTIYLPIRRVDLQVSIFAGVIVIFSCLLIFGLGYTVTYRDMVHSLSERVTAIHEFLDAEFDKSSFFDINTAADKDTELYHDMKTLLEMVKNSAGVRYLYTAKQNDAGEFIYIIDGLSFSASDFRNPGDLIEQEIIPDMRRALNGEIVMPTDIKDTGWGKIFIAYLPIHQDEKVVGVLGIEFEAEHQFAAYRLLRVLMPPIILGVCGLSALLAFVLFRRISNPLFKDLSNTDQLTQLKNRNAFDLDMKNYAALNRSDRVGFVSIDLNDLKKVNDTMGHRGGDMYLQQMAKALHFAQKSGEILYRVGGDEFAVVQLDADEDSLERFMSEVQAEFDRLAPEWPVKTSFSWGGAVSREDDEGAPTEVWRRADDAMYRSKRRYHEGSK